jgi:hypothetical protein
VDEHRHLLVRDLREDVDRLHSRELGRIRHGLSRGEDERLAHGAVAGVGELDSNAVYLLDVRRNIGQRSDERGRLIAERPLAVEPTPKLALLPAGQ